MSATALNITFRRGDGDFDTFCVVRHYYEMLPERTGIGVDLCALVNDVELVSVQPDKRNAVVERFHFDLFGPLLGVVPRADIDKLDNGEECWFNMGRYGVLLVPVRSDQDLASVWIEVVRDAHAIKLAQEDRKKRETHARQEALETCTHPSAWTDLRFFLKTLKSEVGALLGR